MADQNIIDKVRKLLELADETRGGTEAERELAAQRAQELMLKHNLAQSEIHGQSAAGDVGEDANRVEGSMSEWKVMLALRLGKVCFVDGYYVQRARFAWDVVQVGRADNIAFVKTLCEHLIPWLEQEASDAFKAAKSDGENVKPRSFRRAFYDSAIWTIAGRLSTLRNQQMGSTGTELVRNEAAANKQYLEERGVRLRSRQSRGFSSHSGHAAGAEAGRRADLAPGRKLGK